MVVVVVGSTLPLQLLHGAVNCTKTAIIPCTAAGATPSGFYGRICRFCTAAFRRTILNKPQWKVPVKGYVAHSSGAEH